MLKITDNPPIVYPENATLEEIQGQWWVAHTKSRNEKALATTLSRWDIAYFLPLVEKVSHRKGRKYRSLLPLFGGYLFFCGDEQARYQALTTNRIAQIIKVIDQKQLIYELTAINHAIASGMPIDPHPSLTKGMRCRVSGGPLMGQEGFVVRRNKSTRILLQVEMLGQAAAVEIDADLLEQL